MVYWKYHAKDAEHNDILIKVILRNNTNNLFTWPQQNDECWTPLINILCLISAQLIQGSSGRQFKLKEGLLKNMNNF